MVMYYSRHCESIEPERHKWPKYFLSFLSSDGLSENAVAFSI